MKLIITALALFFLSVAAQAQFQYQGISPQNETLNLNSSSIWTKSFAFKNIGESAATLNLALSGLDSSKFIIAKNRCNISVSIGKTCVVTLSSIRGIQKRLTPYSVSYGELSINLSVTNSATPPVNDSPSPIVSSLSLSPNSVDAMDFFNGERSKDINLVIANDGDIIENPVVSLDAGDLDVIVVIDRCNGSLVESRKSCSYRLKVNNPLTNTIKTRLIKVSSNSGEKDSILISASQNIIVQYVSTLSSYSPPIPSNSQACDGTVVSNRSILECKRQHDNVVVSNSLCEVDSMPSVTTQSPAGNKIISISNGSETYSCLAGSSVQTFVSRTCDTNYSYNGSVCVLTQFAPFLKITSGNSHSCVVSSNDLAYCWGSSAGGQLGNGSNASSGFPVAVVTSGVLSGKTIKSMEAGTGNVCAIASDDKVYCWGGGGGGGALGNGATLDSNVPVAVSTAGVLNNKTIKAVASGNFFSCVIASDDKVYCWGNNFGGKLGNGTISNTSVPTAVNMSGVLVGKTVKQLSAGSEHMCVIASDDKIYCWGFGGTGQLGNGGTSQSTVPVAVTMNGVLNGKTAKYLASGYSHSCVIASDDRVYCWGYNINGQLGNNSTTQSNVPVAVDSSVALNNKVITSISAGSFHTCGVDSNGLGYCWGFNQYGQLGDGSTAQSLVPVAINMGGVLSGKILTYIAAGEHNNCALTTENQAYCWGFNGNGQLGTGNNTTNSSNPLMVLPLPN